MLHRRREPSAAADAAAFYPADHQARRTNDRSPKVAKIHDMSSTHLINSNTPMWRATKNSRSFGASTGVDLGARARSSPPLHGHCSPDSRSQAIARGQQELMEMVQNMHESTYELSLRDMVEAAPRTAAPTPPRVERKESRPGKKTAGRSKREKRKEMRGGKIGNGDFLLKMFFPSYLKRDGSGKGRVSPVKNSEGEWWKKRESQRSGSSSISSSNSSTQTRHWGGCWALWKTNKSKSRIPKERSFF